MWLESWVVMKHIALFHLGNKFNLLHEKRNFTTDEVGGSYYERQITGKDFAKKYCIINYRFAYVAHNLVLCYIYNKNVTTLKFYIKMSAYKPLNK
jgi:hypothetical protein